MAEGSGTQTNARSPRVYYIGTQISSGKGYTAMGRDAVKIGANTLQFFLRNPRGSKARPLNRDDLAGLSAVLAENNFGKIMAHAPYTVNACSRDPHLRELSAQMFSEDLDRMDLLPGNYYNFHPGSRQDQELSAAVDYIAGMLRTVLAGSRPTTVLLETMAGKGSEVGRNFEELAAIIDKAALPGDSLGICFDACHLWDSGYDIVHDLDGVLENFDRIIGLKYLKAFHINDSQNGRGSRKDRHAVLGGGYIGMDAILAIISHPALRGLPFITETPITLEEHREEIARLRERLPV
ncbi:deoxyribonuclease IV [Breznakiella homolactica]|uniref:Probable endonuclease 4 n=1 Tax=Breznakiella homolactica TaxID=2798577 RepID=A0A7T7XLY0_9SPIR|nr:deoxyribonuclease IV [Breznakiella homolactica]QQO08806.1 deoxyribonuclease IV [Breznakiella homolactica]